MGDSAPSLVVMILLLSLAPITREKVQLYAKCYLGCRWQHTLSQLAKCCRVLKFGRQLTRTKFGMSFGLLENLRQVIQSSTILQGKVQGKTL
ncbi:hypothetical protein CBM2609_A110009 [Cupriavidus taiwanensis]|nr:hypothetical protein CBM2604_A90008 [Cupriavidus taiwanensis]SOZ23404.1 hypothetical protein CBM2609_A110009 [Cupriavidus taiwanensis]SOZ43821.1 hypothetical protein CBM2610_A110009 [Cupriavidus taiwanensis]